MGIITISVKKLNSISFNPYGTVIQSDGDFIELNNGMSKKWNELIDPFSFSDSKEGINLGVLKSKPSKLILSQMERHFFTSQAFIPLEGKQYLIIVSPPTEVSPMIEQVEAFIAEGNQGINFHPKTWHCPLIPLEGEMEFVSIMKKSEVPDVEVITLENDIQIDINQSGRK